MSSTILETCHERLREAGYRLTNARLTVLDALITHEEHHLTSSDILEAVNARDDSIGRASVFRTLDLFTRLGLIRPTYLGNNVTPSYVVMADNHHHHIICTKCQRVIEIDECGLGHVEQSLEQRFNVRITGHMVEFFALCEVCRAAD